MKRRIAVFTSSRADLGPLGPVIRCLDADPGVELMVIATGTHVAESFGGRLSDIRLSDGNVLEVLDAALGGTRPTDLGEVYGRIASGMSKTLGTREVHILIVLGDRWELLAAVGAALLHGVPIAHLHGGETTEGAIDERIRHSITKLADLHLCATEDSARRIRHLGEERWRIVVTGAPGLDRLQGVTALSESRIEELLGGPLARPFGVIVYHPPTVDRGRIAERARAVFEASAEALGSGLILFPGADPGSDHVVEEIQKVLGRHPHLAVSRNLGEDYLPALGSADVLIGNSSSGIIEAASLHLPVVDVGERQRGRLRPRNVVHVGEETGEILAGIQRTLDPAFREGLADLENPYGSGDASARIVRALLDAPLDRLMSKPLMEIPTPDRSLDSMVVSPDSTLRDAMAAIDRGRSQIAFVTNDKARLVGTISDGDVRRALLGGAALDDALHDYVTTVPVVATPADTAENVLQLMEQNGVTQIPVVDDQGILLGVHLMRAILSHAFDRTIAGLDDGRDPA